MVNQQSQWIVTCVRADDGMTVERVVWAASRDVAMREASGGGLLAQDAAQVPSAQPADPAVLEALGRIQSSLFELQGDVRKLRYARIVQVPCNTIAGGIVLGLLYWMLLVLVFWVAAFVILAILGISLRPPPIGR